MRQWVNAQPHLSNKIHESVKHIVDFKADMHFFYIRAHKDPNHTWNSLPFVSIVESIDSILDTWPPAWRGLEAVGKNEVAIRKQKEEAKCAAQQK